MVNQALLAQATQLAPADRLELIGQLWQSLDIEDIPITDTERTMLDERLAEIAGAPDSGRAWELVERELRRRLT